MIPGWPAAEPPRIRDPYERSLVWRARGIWTRVAQASLIGVLVWLATGSRLALAWWGASVTAAAIDSRICAHFAGRPRTRTSTLVTFSGQAAAAAGFSAVALVLLWTPSPIRLAEAVLVLCAVSL